MDFALHLQGDKEDGYVRDEPHFLHLCNSGISGKDCLLPVKVWMGELLSCFRALNKAECHPPTYKAEANSQHHQCRQRENVPPLP